ncbi:hypothetical protein Tco_0983018 [Tanacetum coccineum]
MYEKIKRLDEDFIAIGSVEDESLIKRMNKKDSSKGEEIKQESKEEVKEEDKRNENTMKRKHFDESKRSEEINMNVVTRSNGQKRCFSTLIRSVLSVFDREDLDWVHTLMTDEGLVVHMLIEKKYPLKKEILMQMLKLKLESEEESTMVLELIRFIKKVLADLESKDKTDGK